MAIAAVSLSITVMILAIATGKGLQEKISDKVIGFTSDIQVEVLDLNQSLEATPLTVDSTLINSLSLVEGVAHTQKFITKNALIKTDEEFEGVIIKGVDENYNWHFIESHLTKGKIPEYSSAKKSSDIIISKKLAQKLNLSIQDKVLFYFQGKKSNQPLIRKLTITGVYETGIELFDDVYILADIKHLQKINHWETNQCSSLEIQVKEDYNSTEVYKNVEMVTSYDTRVHSAKELYPQIFDWIKLFDLNILIVLLIMILVASINMISSLLIIILERTKMIGLMKAMGGTNASIKKIFLYHTFYLLRKGLLIGNGIGLTFIGIQYYFTPIKLDPNHYYVRELPVILSIENWVMINLLSIIICMLILIIPTLLIQKVDPIKTLRYE